MIVFYTKDNQSVMGWTRGTPDLVISSKGVRSVDLVMRGVDWDKVEYKEVPDQEIKRKYEEGEDGAREVTQTLSELNLRDFTVEELEERLKPDIETRVKALEDRVFEIKPVRR